MSGLSGDRWDGNRFAEYLNVRIFVSVDVREHGVECTCRCSHLEQNTS